MALLEFRISFTEFVIPIALFEKFLLLQFYLECLSQQHD